MTGHDTGEEEELPQPEPVINISKWDVWLLAAIASVGWIGLFTGSILAVGEVALIKPQRLVLMALHGIVFTAITHAANQYRKTDRSIPEVTDQ